MPISRAFLLSSVHLRKDVLAVEACSHTRVL